MGLLQFSLEPWEKQEKCPGVPPKFSSPNFAAKEFDSSGSDGNPAKTREISRCCPSFSSPDLAAKERKDIPS
jgi:hypothetical protein